MGAGMINGHFYTGAQISKSFEKGTVTVGSDNVTFDLPTDIFQSGHYLTVVGVGVRSKVNDANIYTFLGESSTSFNSPFFAGARAEHPAYILFASGKVAPQWTAATRVLLPFSTRATIIHSFSYDDDRGTKFALAGGMGTGQLYMASSISMSHRIYDLKATYIESSTQFRRASIAAPLTAEPDRDNTLFTVRPTGWSSLSVGHQNYLTPIYNSDQNVRSTVNQASASVQLIGASLSASIYQSIYAGSHNLATAYSASRTLGSRIHAQASYLISRPDNFPESTSFITNIQERLTPRWSISQMVNSSGGRNTAGFGGSFLSNLVTLSADYQTFYVPSRISNPFEEALIVNAEIHLLGGLSLSGGTFVAPDGSLLYTTKAEGTISRDQRETPMAIAHHAIGQMVVRGKVIDSSGQPIMGAALLVDQLPVYTDSQGYFIVREQKSHRHPLTVLVDQFLDGQLYKVISAPVEVHSSTTDDSDAIVIVQRLDTVKS